MLPIDTFVTTHFFELSEGDVAYALDYDQSICMVGTANGFTIAVFPELEDQKFVTGETEHFEGLGHVIKNTSLVVDHHTVEKYHGMADPIGSIVVLRGQIFICAKAKKNAEKILVKIGDLDTDKHSMLAVAYPKWSIVVPDLKDTQTLFSTST
ncbi:hypothetical protein GCM10009096_10460 [Parasphingorhabdus litoris]|uniref:Uncharacterized protein n=2 Tax=Parasphingorhabdus litoris TaxID=394733 RepID=A0ABN1AA73_9SPHN